MVWEGMRDRNVGICSLDSVIPSCFQHGNPVLALPGQADVCSVRPAPEVLCSWNLQN